MTATEAPNRELIAPAATWTAEKKALVETAVTRAGKLAALPEIALEVMRLVRDPNASGQDLANLLSRDPALSVRVLKIVNSAFYSLRREVTSVSGAIAVLGFGVVNNIAVAASLARMFRLGKIGNGFEPRDLWTHAVAVAAGARQLAIELHGISPEEAFLAGLVHDIGMIVELQAHGAEFSALINNTANNPELSFRAAELECIGATHEEFGWALCEKWRFPDTLKRVSGFHHNPMLVPADERRLTAIVHVADHLAAQPGLGYTRTVEGDTPRSEVCDWLGLSVEKFAEMRERLPALVAEVMPNFS